MDSTIVQQLREGRIGVIPTDTIYGIVGLALNQNTVEKIYHLRKRSPDKPFIILISSLDDLNIFGVPLNRNQKEFLEKHWPNPLSVVLSVIDEKWQYLHRGTKSLAFRMPKNGQLLELLKQTGPLVAPSANFEGEKPSENIAEAKKHFGESIDFYMDGGPVKSAASTLIELLTDGSFKMLRQGKLKL